VEKSVLIFYLCDIVNAVSYISKVLYDSLPEPITSADNMDDDICK
jgi:hypothetical protein